MSVFKDKRVRSNSIDLGKSPVLDAGLNDVKHSSSMKTMDDLDAMELLKKKEKEKGKDKEKEKKPNVTVDTGKAKNVQLKEKAKDIPIVFAKRTVEQIVAEEMLNAHTTLEAEEDRIFKTRVNQIDKKRFNAIKDSEKEKRVENAKQRLNYSKEIVKIETARENEVNEHVPVDKDKLIEKIKAFKKLPENGADLDKDEKFIENLAKNYHICDAAEEMKRCIDEAIEGGFFPEDYDLEDLEVRIERYREIKKYLDVQSTLMKNPYYAYLAKKDVKYTKEQLDEMIDGTKNETLREYLTSLRTLRSLAFIRSKGMKSVKDRVERSARHEMELIQNRENRRICKERLTKEALEFGSDERFTRKDYADTFTEKNYRALLASFYSLNITDLHMDNIRDMSEHFSENAVIFRQVRQMQDFLYHAVLKNIGPSDEQLLKLRAKIRAFNNLEEYMYRIQSVILDNEGSDKMTDKDVEEAAKTFIKNEKHYDAVGDFSFGMNLSKYEKSIQNAFKKEHSNREDTIRRMYGLTHPEAKKIKSGKSTETVWEPGNISAAELTKRSRDYQKNAMIMDTLYDMYRYFDGVSNVRLNLIEKLYGKGKDITNITGNARVPSSYAMGRSSDEIKRMLDRAASGDPKEMEKNWKEFYDECNSADLMEFDSKDPQTFFTNAAYKLRMGSMFANIKDAADEVKDPELQKKIRALYSVGCGSGVGIFTIGQGAVGEFFRASSFEDWINKDYKKVQSFMGDVATERNEFSRQIDKNGDQYVMTNAFKPINDGLNKIFTLNDSVISRDYGNVYANPFTHRYVELKKEGAIKDMTPEEFETFKGFYSQFQEDYLARCESEKKRLAAAYGPSTYRMHLFDCLSTLKGKEFKDRKDDFYKELYLIDNNSKDKAAVQKKVERVEEIFETLMSFDISEINFNSYMDIISDKERFARWHAITVVGMEMDTYIQMYHELQKNPNAECHIDKKMQDEILARADLLKNAFQFFGGDIVKIMNSDLMKDTGLSFEQIIHMPREEILNRMEKAAKAGEGEKVNLWSWLMTLVDTLGGFDVGVDLRTIENRIRKVKKLGPSSSPDDALNFLKEKGKSVFDKNPSSDFQVSVTERKDYLAEFNKSFDIEDISVTDREDRLQRPKSRLYKKRVNAENVILESQKSVNRIMGAKNMIPDKIRMRIPQDRLDDLASFMTGDAKADAKMVEQYLDPKKKTAVLDRMTREIMNINARVNINSDADLAAHAQDLETLSRMVRAYENLLEANPEYKERLHIKRTGQKESDFHIVRNRIWHMHKLSDYYRARKLLITDSYYRMHFNEEISGNHDRYTTPEQRRVADLINLVARCADALNGRTLERDSETGMDKILDRYEEEAASQAYVTGAPDLEKATASSTKQAVKEIRKYFSVVNPVLPAEKDEDGDEVERDADDIDYKIDPKEMLKIIGNSDDHPFPEAVKYETPAVKAYLKNLRNQLRVKNKLKEVGGKNNKGLTDAMTPKQLDMYNRLRAATKVKGSDGKDSYISKMRLEDPKTGEVFDSDINLSRLIPNIVLTYANDTPVEELVDMVEGLCIGQKGQLDLNDPVQMNYARTRWLSSYKKLFKLQHAAMKRVENTYGAYPDQLSIASFMTSLGDGMMDFGNRTLFTQDLTQTIDKRTCSVGGESISPAQLLLKHGMISQEELDECFAKNKEFYQTAVYATSGYYSDPLELFRSELHVSYTHTQNDLNGQMDTLRKHDFAGRKLSFAEERKLWKDLLKQKDDVLTGDEEFIKSKKMKLDLLTKEEKRRIKEERTAQNEVYQRHLQAYRDKKNTLIAEVKTKYKDTVPDEFIGKVISLHPALLSDKKPEDEDVNAFYNAVNLYFDLGEKVKDKKLSPEDISKNRALAIRKFFDLYERASGKVLRATDKFFTKDVMKKGAAVKPTDTLYMNILLSDASVFLQDIVVGEKDAGAIDIIKKEDLQFGNGMLYDRIFKNRQTALENDIFLKLLSSELYLGLKDIGNRGQSLPEKEFLQLQNLMVRMQTDRNYDMTRDLTDEEIGLLARYGIDVKLVRNNSVISSEVKKVEVKDPEKDQAPASDKKEDIKAKEKKDKKKSGKLSVVDEILAQQQGLHLDLDPIDYDHNAKAHDRGPHVKYEGQGDSTYCWACVMSGLINSRAGREVSNLDTIRQRPLQIPRYHESGIPKYETYLEGVQLVEDMYNGVDYGNPAIFGDYIFQKVPDTAVRSAIIAREEGRLPYCKRRFLETLGKALEKGPVGMLYAGHFVLIYELKGDKFMVRDSMGSNPDDLVEYRYNANNIFASSGQQVELCWLEDINGHENELADKFGLNYDQTTRGFSAGDNTQQNAGGAGQSNRREIKNAQTILHRDGVEAMTNLYDDVVFDSIYVPKRRNAAPGAGNGQGNAQGGVPVVDQVPVQDQKKKDKKESDQKDVKGGDQVPVQDQKKKTDKEPEPPKKEEDKKKETKVEDQDQKKKDKKEAEVPKQDQDQKTKEVKAQPKKRMTWEEKLAEFEDTFRDCGLSKAEMDEMRDTLKASYEYTRDIENAFSREEEEAVKETIPGFDDRGLRYLLHPVKLNEKGEPLTKEDADNQAINRRYINSLKSGKLSDRKEFLDYVAKEAESLMYTVEELQDPAFIRSDRNRALRHLSFMHNMLNVFSKHADYYLTKAPEKYRSLMCILNRNTDYINYSAFMIQRALFDKGLPLADFGKSSGMAGYIPYKKGMDYQKLRAENERIGTLGYTQGLVVASTQFNMSLKGMDIFDEKKRKVYIPEDQRDMERGRANEMERILIDQLLGEKKKAYSPEDRVALIKNRLDAYRAKKDKKSFLDKEAKSIRLLRSLDYAVRRNKADLTDDLKADDQQLKDFKKEDYLKMRTVGKDVAVSENMSKLANKTAVKEGKFNAAFLAEAERFMEKVDMWSGIRTKLEEPILRRMDIRDTVDCLYVDGLPIQAFVAKQYKYTGNDVSILRAYAAMIAGRQNHPITFMCPVMDYKGDVDIIAAPLKLDTKALGDKAPANKDKYKEKQTGFLKSLISYKSGELVTRFKTAQIASMSRKKMPILDRTSELLHRLYAINDGSDPAFNRVAREVGRYFNVLQNTVRLGLESAADMQTMNNIINYSIFAQNALAEYSREKGSGRQNKATTERMNIVKELNLLISNHDRLLHDEIGKTFMKGGGKAKLNPIYERADDQTNRAMQARKKK